MSEDRIQNNSEEKAKGRSGKKKLRSWQIIVLNLLAMVLVSVVLIGTTMSWLGRYTRHDEVLRVPELRGLAQEDARQELEKMGLFLHISDSIYDESQVPGVVLETTPKAGATIKSHRTIYATVNNSEVKQYLIPSIQDQSLRQAEALLRANGFVNVTLEYVPGPLTT